MIATEKGTVIGNVSMTTIVVYMIGMDGDGGRAHQGREAEVDQGRYLKISTLISLVFEFRKKNRAVGKNES